MTMKRALVTGAGGFVGRFMIELLREKGYPVVATDVAKANVSYLKELEVEFRAADLLDPDSLQAAVKDIDVIYHIAAIFKYSAGYNAMYKVNVKGVENLCEAAKDAGIQKFVHWSSGEVYGRAMQLPTTEECPLRPLHPYGRTKMLGEQAALRYHAEHGLPVVVLRPTAIYGPRARYGVYQVFKLMYYDMIPGYLGPDDVMGHLVHVKDVIGAALHLAEYEKSVGQIYNIADDTPITTHDLIRLTCEILNKPAPKINLPLNRSILEFFSRLTEHIGHLTHTDPLFEKDTIRTMFEDNVFSNKKLKETGYTLQYPLLREGLKETIQWLLENKYFEPVPKVVCNWVMEKARKVHIELELVWD